MRIIVIAFSSLKTAHGEPEPAPKGGLGFKGKYDMDFGHRFAVSEIPEATLEFREWPIGKNVYIQRIALSLQEAVETDPSDHGGVIGA